MRKMYQKEEEFVVQKFKVLTVLDRQLPSTLLLVVFWFISVDQGMGTLASFSWFGLLYAERLTYQRQFWLRPPGVFFRSQSNLPIF